jgi:hypothetical protein
VLDRISNEEHYRPFRMSTMWRHPHRFAGWCYLAAMILVLCHGECGIGVASTTPSRSMPVGALVTVVPAGATTTVRPAGVRTTLTFPLVIPQGVPLQRDGAWFIIELSVVVTGGKHGVAVVSAATNGRTAMQITVGPAKRRGLRPGLAWQEFDISDGPHAGTLVAGVPTTLRFRNYLRANGIARGRNLFTVTIERLRGNAVSSLTVGRASGVRRVAAGPGRLGMQVEIPHRGLREGAELDAIVHVMRVGGVTARRVVLSAEADSGLVVTPPSYAMGDIETGEQTGTFRIRANASGRHVLRVWARGIGGGTSVAIRIPVGPRESFPNDGWTRWLFSGGVGLVGAITLVVVQMQRRRRKSALETVE